MLRKALRCHHAEHLWPAITSLWEIFMKVLLGMMPECCALTSHLFLSPSPLKMINDSVCAYTPHCAALSLTSALSLSSTFRYHRLIKMLTNGIALLRQREEWQSYNL